MSMKIYLALFLIVLSNCAGSKKYFYLEFYRAYDSIDPDNNVFNTLTNNHLLANITIGTPNQHMQLCLRMDSFATWLRNAPEGQNDKTKFNKKSSTTYIQTKDELPYSSEDYYNAAKSNDTFSISSIEMQNFQFMLSSESPLSNICPGVIGLHLENKAYSDTNDLNLIQQFKKEDLFNSYAFAIRYNKIDSGQIIAGDYLHNFDYGYDSNTFVYTKTIDIYSLVWGLKFEKIIYDEKEIPNNSLVARFRLEYGFIQAPKEFNWQIENKYFNQYLYKGRCEKVVISSGETGIKCDKDIDLSIFPPIEFYHKELDYVFRFEAQDLFYEKNNKKWCLLVFNYDTLHWILGAPFFRKYELTFDQDKKTIGLYKFKAYRYVFGNWWFAIALLIVFLFGAITYMIMFQVRKPRKLRAIELEEKFAYIPQLKITT